ncbi:amidohydrolase [Candidatus Bathyarchaeota archaeon]|nr:amidohydrolase [Candidatus Bathyarchaeota archaeon]
MSKIQKEKQTALGFVDENRQWLSDFHMEIWNLAEPAFREYRSAAAYVKLLRDDGWTVEEGSGEMPTAFCAVWGEGKPVIGGFAEYDAVPGMSQAPVPYRKPRDENLHPYAAGHTDPHSALGTGALFGFLAAKHAMEKHKLKGTLKLFGEPAEKVCGSKPVHAAKGYFDDFDASIPYHPSGYNTVRYEINAASYWNTLYTFETLHPENWFRPKDVPFNILGHAGGRIPAALDAVCLMYTATKYVEDAMLPYTAYWTMNEYIMVGGQATSDNLPPRIAQIQYAHRAPLLEMQEQISNVLDNTAKGVAQITGTRVTKRIIARTRVGLSNKKLSEVLYRNLQTVGPPVFGEEAREFGRKIQENLGFEPMEEPLTEACQTIAPRDYFDKDIRYKFPAWVTTQGSDDYVDYQWTAPSTRLNTANAGLRNPDPNKSLPPWTRLAMNGYSPCIDPGIVTASKTIGTTIVDLLTHPGELAQAKEEFDERTGGGVGGSRWVAPLLPKDFYPPIDLPWPEYVTTQRGFEWSLTKPGPEKEYKVLHEGV